MKIILSRYLQHYSLALNRRDMNDGFIITKRQGA
jgi:hypothetical protein